ncbi:hypothetical protein EPJ74_00440 [Brachyspira aalborgi]|uniref:Endonuclease GajA/Old nuclease/RecF-like AAA domain-containing protein n=2 Tax=Brachyspira aalborgi TaxID=29522 RepID=A0A5C8GIL2_9SPIR|nr:AAA family ATPase [Brachyspira aalborgi]TXJ61646.1 hypothetical protein EPJ74_00440 [Brachyspira aalborgi]
MSQRFLKIKNFKNIGITKEEDQWERLYLNNSLDKDKIGELIILIGENNVGKSNILDAINTISLASKSKKSQNFKNCMPDFMDYEECLPKLKLVYKDDENNSCDLELNIDEEGNAELLNSLPKDTKIIEPELNLDKVIKEFESKFSSYTKEIRDYGYNNYELDNIIKDYNNIIDSKENINTKYEKLKGLYARLAEFFRYFVDYYNGRVGYSLQIKELTFIDLDTIAYIKQKDVDIIKEKYDIDFIPNIVLYKEEHIKDEDLITTPEKIKDSKFFNSLFKAIGKPISTVKTNYEKSNPAFIKKYQENINKRLKDIVNDRFNELFFQKSELETLETTQNYDFSIELEENRIYLSICKNDEVLTLSKQSVGFKRFFNFFFNFLYTNELKAGDIVLMDEPEIHLSIPGRRDLRKFIKKFAKDTGITFIATTHNPSFVDIDYLDELRIIKNNKDGIGVKIQSNFSALADDEVDTLDSIINSFGILRSDLTREYKIIFVEGITDYNYLTAFKLLYNKDKEDKKEYDKKLNIVFIPIYGLGKDDNEMEKKLDKLIQFKDAILLTDGDTRGNAFKKLCDNEKLKGRLTVIQLTEIENSFKNIENLFAQSDKEKFKDIIENKGIEKSSPFKNSIAQLELDAKTIENFNKVLKYLNEMS